MSLLYHISIPQEKRNDSFVEKGGEYSKAYSELCQACKRQSFTKIDNGSVV